MFPEPKGETTATSAAANTTRSAAITINVTFLSSISCFLYVAEFVFGLICWTIIASGGGWGSQYSYVMFVGITSWLLTICLLLIHIFSIAENHLQSISWPIVELVYHVFWSLMYFIAFCIIAANSHNRWGVISKLAASAAFGFFTTVAYVAHAVVSFKKWRGNTPEESEVRT